MCKDNMTVCAYNVGCIQHLHIRVITTTSYRRSGYSAALLLIINRSLWNWKGKKQQL